MVAWNGTRSMPWYWRGRYERRFCDSLGTFAYKKALEYFAIFAVGASVYYGIEILWRGYSHWTMAMVGGIALIIIGLLNEGFLPTKWGLIPQMLVGAGIITAIEFVAGFILNMVLGLGIWDYSNMWGNFLGQICILYTFFWFLLSGVAIFVDDFIRCRFFDEPKPHYDIWYCKHDM